MIQHRPPEEMLVDYATGALPQPVAMAVATHAQLCAESQQDIQAMEAVGGAMLVDLEPVPVSEGALAKVLKQIGEAPATAEHGAAPDARVQADTDAVGSLHRDVLAVLEGKGESIHWKRKGPAVSSAALPCDVPGFDLRLLKIKAGKAVPQHTHDGMEITLCLSGGYSDGDAHYARGDFQVADPSLDHRPVADDDGDCIVLAVVEKRIRLTSRTGRLINPFVRL